MKLTFPLLACMTSGSALVLSPPNTARSLLPRVDDKQQLTNPDNEPGYTNRITGTHTAASRVLSGIDPQAARERYFDWDESCTDPEQRRQIVGAYENVLTLTASASDHLQTLKENLPIPPGTSANKENRKYIFEKDPAYAQMFDGQDFRLDWVQKSFDLISEHAPQLPQDRYTKNRGGLRFVCNKENQVKQSSENPDKPFCETLTQAANAPPWDGKQAKRLNIEEKYLLQHSSIIVFCPQFFNNFPGFETIADRTSKGEGVQLNDADCRERILLHEYMHMRWIRNSSGDSDKDKTGWEAAALTAATGSWVTFRVHPDNYAWFAIYAFLNNNNKGCGGDAWPSGVDKPVKE